MEFGKELEMIFVRSTIKVWTVENTPRYVLTKDYSLDYLIISYIKTHQLTNASVFKH